MASKWLRAFYVAIQTNDQWVLSSPLKEVREISLLQSHLHDDVASFVYKRLKRRPMVLPVVVEV